MIQALERRTLFEATVVCDSPVQDPALATESESPPPVCESPVQDPALEAESSLLSYPPPTANRPPVIAANGSSVGANEGSYATMTGTASDPDYDFLTFTASLGSVFASGGGWTWSYAPPDGPATLPVTVTASDGRGGTAQTSFTLNVSNVDPTFSISGESTVVSNGTYTLARSAISDPGTDTVSGWTVSWGDGSSTSYPGNQSTFSHPYPSGPPATFAITATATDEDGSYSRQTSVRREKTVLTAPELTDNRIALGRGDVRRVKIHAAGEETGRPARGIFVEPQTATGEILATAEDPEEGTDSNGDTYILITVTDAAVVGQTYGVQVLEEDNPDVSCDIDVMIIDN